MGFVRVFRVLADGQQERLPWHVARERRERVTLTACGMLLAPRALEDAIVVVEYTDVGSKVERACARCGGAG